MDDVGRAVGLIWEELDLYLVDSQGSLLLIWFNFDLSMDK